MRFVLIVFVVKLMQCERNNVCKEFDQYQRIDTDSNCRFNPDVTGRMEDIVKRHGYPLESYEAVTEDFFVLTVFRIPNRSKHVKGVVFLQHPALSSSTVWVVAENESFAFLLANEGYDVWMGNFRANSYSAKHLNLSRQFQPSAYWNHSFHEFGLYDLPAQINLVREKTSNRHKILYIGHSVATSAGLIYSSLKPKEAENHIQLFVFWSPVAFLGNVKTFAKVFAPYTNLIEQFIRSLGILGLTYDGSLHSFWTSLCTTYLKLCSNFIDILVGPQSLGGNPEMLPLLFTQSVEGFSLKGLAHFGQLVHAKDRFQQYTNKLTVKVPYTSHYPLEKITIPIRLVYGDNDYFSTEKDIFVLYSKLPNKVKRGVQKVEGYSHFDFHYAKTLKQQLHIPIIKFLDHYLTKQKP